MYEWMTILPLSRNCGASCMYAWPIYHGQQENRSGCASRDEVAPSKELFSFSSDSCAILQLEKRSNRGHQRRVGRGVTQMTQMMDSAWCIAGLCLFYYY